MSEIVYPFDPTGRAITNYIVEEQHIVTEANYRDYFFIVPKFAPFFADRVIVKHHNLNEVRTLVEGTDYYLALNYLGATRSIGQPIYGAISLNSLINIGIITVSYQTLGGPWCADVGYVTEYLAEKHYNPRLVVWDQVTNVQETFPPINHQHDFEILAGYEDLIQAIVNLSSTIADIPNQSPVIKHLINYNNPHSVTLEQIGYTIATLNQTLLGEPLNALINTKILKEAIEHYKQAIDADISSIAINTNSALQSLLDHVRNTNNPHLVNKAQIGLANVPNLALAHDSEVANRDPVDKFVTLRQIIKLLESFDFSNPDTGVDENYILYPVANAVNEGDGLLIHLVTNNVPNYTTLFWSIAHISTNEDDFINTSGNVTVINNGASFVVQTAQDIKTEGNELFVIRLRKDSVTGPIVANTPNIAIINQVLTSEFDTTIVPNILTKSQTASVSVTATQIPNNTKAYWNLVSINGDLNNFAANNGSFTFINNVGLFNLTVVDNLVITSEQSFKLEIRLDSTSGTVIDEYSTITIQKNVDDINKYLVSSVFDTRVSVSPDSLFVINSCHPASCTRKS